MTKRRKTPGFIAQFETSKNRMDDWPKWMRDAARVASATFPAPPRAAETDWFPGSVKPHHKGVYKRAFPSGTYFSKWSGRKWLRRGETAAEADAQTQESPDQDWPWRGLAVKPQP